VARKNIVRVAVNVGFAPGHEMTTGPLKVERLNSADQEHVLFPPKKVVELSLAVTKLNCSAFGVVKLNLARPAPNS